MRRGNRLRQEKNDEEMIWKGRRSPQERIVLKPRVFTLHFSLLFFLLSFSFFSFSLLSLRPSASFALEESSFQKPKGFKRKSEVILKAENEGVISEK